MEQQPAIPEPVAPVQYVPAPEVPAAVPAAPEAPPAAPVDMSANIAIDTGNFGGAAVGAGANLEDTGEQELVVVSTKHSIFSVK